MRLDCTNADKQFYLFCLIELAQGQTKINKNTRRTLRVIRANVIPSGFEWLKAIIEGVPKSRKRFGKNDRDNRGNR